jgi:tyrosyl-tRNA synthetase
MLILTHPATLGKQAMHLYQDLLARGLSYQQTDEAALDLALRDPAKPITVYVGFDPTSDSLHVGSLLGLLVLRRFQQAGHRAVALMGGATGMIGDPSGKKHERSLLDEERLRHNIDGIARCARSILSFEGANSARLVNNYDWFKELDVLWFLREVGKHFTINHMVGKESVRARLEDREHGISYTEFSYMLLQAYDFYRLYKDLGCTLQVGGSDQWGNITAGIELTRRKEAADFSGEAPKLFGLTHPLVMKADGTKFGKSEQGTIWLDAAKTSPYRFYQFFVQSADADVMTYLKYFTFLPLAQISELGDSLTTQPEKRAAQYALAREVTRLVHGETELARAERASQALFGESIRELDEATLLDVMAEAPSTQKSRSALESYAIVDALVDSGLCASKGAARRDIAAGGIYVNNDRVSDGNASLSTADLIAGGHVVLRKGRKNHHLLRFG